MMAAVRALLPLKDLVQAKSRLAGLLRPSERRALVQAMVEDVLAVLSGHPGVASITLLSDDPAAHLLAGQYSARCLRESELGQRGLNAVLAAAVARLASEDSGPVLVLHGDLPLLAAADISAVTAAQQASGGLVIGCDRHGTGTNLLVFDGRAAPRFCFGTDSCGAHLAVAQEAGIPAQVLRRPGIALDVDEPQDIALLLAALQRGEQGRTAALLVGTELGARIALTLASLGAAATMDQEEVG